MMDRYTPKIKLCGMTNVHDVQAALDYGAEFIGLIFAQESPRSVDLMVAKKIVDLVSQANEKSGGNVQVVGVFRNQDTQTIQRTVDALDLPLVQLHGKESPEQCKAISVPVIKVFEVDDEFAWQDVLQFSQNISYIMVDCPKSFQGQKDTWLKQAVDICAARGDDLPPLFFAGNLNAENVGFVINRVEPFAVDVASGVEKDPGTKDLAKMKNFCLSVEKAVSL